jgi:hypothetical protein
MTDELEPTEASLRAALHDAAAHLPAAARAIPPTVPTDDAPRRGRRGSALLVAAAVAVALVAVPIAFGLWRDDSDPSTVRIDGSDAKGTVLAALDATVGSGSYDLDFTFHVEPGNTGQPAGTVPCTGTKPAGAEMTCVAVQPAMRSVDATGHGTVNTDPYAMTVVSQVSDLGPITLFVNGTSVWEVGGAGYGVNGAGSGASPGASLSGFASLVEGTLGQGQGAISMISLANHTGYLGIEREAVLGATAAGAGALDDGTPISYYDVTVDVRRLADSPALTDEQRRALADAFTTLEAAGYTTTDERVGIDGAGFVREVTSTTKFADGSSMTRHSVFSKFGCAGTVTMPNEPAAPTPPACPTAATTTTPASTTLPPTSTVPATTLPPTTIVTVTLPPATAPPTSTPASTTGG